MEPARLFTARARGRGECVIRPVGELTETTAPALRSSITRTVLEGARRIVVDLSLTSRIDESGRDVLVRCSRAVRAADATLVVAAGPGHVAELSEAEARGDTHDPLTIEALVETGEPA